MATSSSFLPHHSLCFKVLRTRLVPRRPVWAGNIDGSDLVSNLALQPIYVSVLAVFAGLCHDLILLQVINLGGASLVDFAKRDFSEPNCRQRLSYSQHSGHINGPGSSNCAYLPHEMKVANRALEERRMDRHDRAAYVTNINENLADTLVKNETTQIVALQQNIKFNGGGHSKNLDAAPLEPPAAAPAPNTQAQGACDIIPSEGQDDLPVSRQNARYPAHVCALSVCWLFVRLPSCCCECWCWIVCQSNQASCEAQDKNNPISVAACSFPCLLQ